VLGFFYHAFGDGTQSVRFIQQNLGSFIYLFYRQCFAYPYYFSFFFGALLWLEGATLGVVLEVEARPS
jgi:hypothetical protein